MNKKQRKVKVKRAASGYQAARYKSHRTLVDMISKLMQERADELMRQQYSIVG
jgi:DNA-binding FadR family transcriptional regulator